MRLIFHRGRPKEDGEYLVIEKYNGGHRYHIYDFTVAGGWNTFYNKEGKLTPSEVYNKEHDDMFQKDIRGFLPTKVTLPDAFDRFAQIEDEMAMLMNDIEDEDPDAYEGIADALDRLTRAHDEFERGYME